MQSSASSFISSQTDGGEYRDVSTYTATSCTLLLYKQWESYYGFNNMHNIKRAGGEVYLVLVSLDLEVESYTKSQERNGQHLFVWSPVIFMKAGGRSSLQEIHLKTEFTSAVS